MIAVAFEPPLDTSQQLIDEDVTPALVIGSSLVNLLKTSPIEVHRQLYKVAEERDGFYPYQVGKLPFKFIDSAVDTGKTCGLMASAT